MKHPTLALALIVLLGLTTAVPASADSDKHTGKGTLPPGLQKKVERGGALPPGWEKKLRVGHRLDDDIYRHGSIVALPDDRGLVTMRIEDKLIRMAQDTREVVEILNGD